MLVATQVEPKPPSDLKKFVHHVPLLGRLQPFHAESGSDFVPPHPNGSLNPRVPGYMAENLSTDLTIDVKVSIDKRGKVKNTEVLKGAGTGFGVLAADAAAAAPWEPGHTHDHAVDSDVIVHYRFRPAE
ncbi:MAG TPA: energy transducer TonB [Bryobacteraceae bacterium]|nr:energy transducer TonB [Bryobacteraceae bacterium]